MTSSSSVVKLAGMRFERVCWDVVGTGRICWDIEGTRRVFWEVGLLILLEDASEVWTMIIELSLEGWEAKVGCRG